MKSIRWNTQYNTIVVGLAILMVLGLILRLAVWKDMGTLSWDEGAHALAGIGLSRSLPDLSYMGQFFSKYWAATGSLFFYPWGYTTLVTPTYWLFGDTVLAARFPNYLLSLLLIPAMFWLAQEALGRRAAWVSACLAAVSPWIIIWSGHALVDVPIVFFLNLALASLFRATKTQRWFWWLLAGMAIGFAGQMKPPGFLFIIPAISYGVYTAYSIKPALRLKNYAGVIVMAISAGLIMGSYFAVGLIAPHVVWFGDHIAANINHWYPWMSIYAEPGDPTWHMVSAWTYYLELLPAQIGLLASLLLIVGLALFVLRKSQPTPVMVFLWLCLLFYYVIFAIIPNKDTRYTMLALPVIWLICAQAALWLYAHLENRASPTQLRAIIVLALVFSALSFMVPSPHSPLAFQERYPLEDIASSIVQDPGLAVVIGQTNWINVQSLSWHVAAQDPHLNSSVYWSDRLAKAKWAVSTKADQPPGFTLYRKYDRLTTAEEYDVYLFRKEMQ